MRTTAIIYALLSLEISWDNGWCFIVVYIQVFFLWLLFYDAYSGIYPEIGRANLPSQTVCSKLTERESKHGLHPQSSYNVIWPAGWWYWYNSLYSSSFSQSWTTIFGRIRSRTWPFSWYKFALVQVWHLPGDATCYRHRTAYFLSLIEFDITWTLCEVPSRKTL